LIVENAWRDKLAGLHLHTTTTTTTTHLSHQRTRYADELSFRFGHQLKTSLLKDWEWHYIDYDRLKDALRATKSDAGWTDDDEQRFVKELESELDKVFTFQKVKSQEIVQQIKAAEAEVNIVISRANDTSPNAPSEEDFLLLEEDLSDIIADVHDLAKFTQLNYTGFTKIIKKHDVSGPDTATRSLEADLVVV
jgi:SPX domain protein involved in polyphosphate accumulation